MIVSQNALYLLCYDLQAFSLNLEEEALQVFLASGTFVVVYHPKVCIHIVYFSYKLTLTQITTDLLLHS